MLNFFPSINLYIGFFKHGQKLVNFLLEIWSERACTNSRRCLEFLSSITIIDLRVIQVERSIEVVDIRFEISFGALFGISRRGHVT